MHAGRLFGFVGSRVTVSAADAAFAALGNIVEVDLVDRRCASAMVRRSNG